MAPSAFRLLCITALIAAVTIATASANRPRTRAPGLRPSSAKSLPREDSLGKYELLNYDPSTDPAAIVVVNGAENSQVRFSVLTSRIIRVETSTTGSFEDRTTVAIVNRKLAVPEFTSKTSGGVLTIATQDLVLSYTVGAAFSGSTLSISPASTSAFKGWAYGQLDTGNLFGTIKSLDNSAILPLNCSDLVNVIKNGESLHCEWAVMSRDGWAIVNDTTNYALDTQYWWAGPNTDKEDFYFFGHGHDYLGALSEFVQIAGRVPLVPRYSLGTWWSRWYDINNVDTAGIVNAYSSRSLPLDVFIYDMDWHTKYYWGGYTFDGRLFPEAADTLAYLKSRSLRVGANLHDADGVRKTDAMHDALARYMGLDPSTCGDIPFSVVNATYVYGVDDVVLAPLEQAGMDFWWLDYQQGGTQGGATGQKQNPTVWTDRIRVTDSLRRGQNVRGMVLARWGGLGNHRYQVGFSGDVSYLGWDTLAYQPYFTLTASNVAYGFWSHDLVGDNNHELHTRWLQWGAYSPIFRTHDRGMAAGSCADNNPPNCAIVEVWRVPTQNFEINRAAMQARAALIPYLYTAARQAYDHGVSLIRPMYYYYPEEPMAYAANNTAFGQYMFGDDMLVSPVVVPIDSTSQMATWSIWLPPGSNWFEKDTGIVYTGGQVLTKAFDLSEIPVYIRSGAVIPTIPVIEGQTLGQAQNQYQELVFSVYTETATAQQGSTEVYEDDGYTYEYITNQAFATTSFSYMLPSNTEIDMTIYTTGTFNEFPATRTYTIRLVNQYPPTSVQVNGATYNYSRFPAATDAGVWTYEGSEATIVIRMLNAPTNSPIRVVVMLPESDNSPLSGVKGYINHARLSKLNLDEAWNSPGSQDMNSQYFLSLASTGPQLSYLAGTNTTLFSSVVSNLQANFESALGELQKLSAPQVNSNRLAYSIALMKAML